MKWPERGSPASPAPAAAPPAAGAARLIDPQTLMSIRNLELRARVVVEGFWSGLHRSPYHGFSVEFSEYRQYTPGDDLRYLDWRLFARSDRFYVKKFQDETNLRGYLLVDQSRSMEYGSVGHTKGEYARTLGATLAYFLYLQGDAVGVLTFDEQLRDFLPARHRTGHLRQLMRYLERPAAGTATDMAAPLKRVVELVRKRSLIILISDLLAPAEALGPSLTSLAACGHETLLFQVLDPAETRFDFDQPALFRDLESGRKLYVDPAAARRHYLGQWHQHQSSLRGACEQRGIGYRQFLTDQPLELALFDFLRERMRRGRSLQRPAPAPRTS